MWSTTFDLELPTFLSLLGTFHFLLHIFLGKKKKNHVGGWKTEIKSKKEKKEKNHICEVRQRNNEKR